MSFEFINQISESKLISNRYFLEQYDLRDIADFAFLYLISLEILAQEERTREEAIDYVKKTVSWGDFDNFRNAATDLYLLFHTMFGKNNKQSYELLKNPKANTRLLDKLYLKYQLVRTWLLDLTRDNVSNAGHKQFLIKLEQMLDIQTSNYVALRRLVADWSNLDNYAKELVMTRLLLAFRTRMPRSELLPLLNKIAKYQDLELDNVENPEEIKENASCGAVSAGAIASIPSLLMASPISRLPITKSKKKKLPKTDK